MKRFNNPLKHVRIASPCTADWDQMIGDERIRFCGQCTLHVYNLSSMSRREAEQLIEHTEGRLCVRYYKRADGSVITKDCPVGLRALRRRMSYLARAVASMVLSFLAGVGINKSMTPSTHFPVTMGSLPVTMGKPEVLLGDMASSVGTAVVGEAEGPIRMGKVARRTFSIKNSRRAPKT